MYEKLYIVSNWNRSSMQTTPASINEHIERFGNMNSSVVIGLGFFLKAASLPFKCNLTLVLVRLLAL